MAQAASKPATGTTGRGVTPLPATTGKNPSRLTTTIPSGRCLAAWITTPATMPPPTAIGTMLSATGWQMNILPARGRHGPATPTTSPPTIKCAANGAASPSHFWMTAPAPAIGKLAKSRPWYRAYTSHSLQYRQDAGNGLPEFPQIGTGCPPRGVNTGFAGKHHNPAITSTNAGFSI